MGYKYTRKHKEYELPFDPTLSGYNYIVCECPAIKFDKVIGDIKKKILLYPHQNHITVNSYNKTLNDWLFNGSNSFEIHKFPANQQEWDNIVNEYGL